MLVQAAVMSLDLNEDEMETFYTLVEKLSQAPVVKVQPVNKFTNSLFGC